MSGRASAVRIAADARCTCAGGVEEAEPVVDDDVAESLLGERGDVGGETAALGAAGAEQPALARRRERLQVTDRRACGGDLPADPVLHGRRRPAVSHVLELEV